MWLISYHVVPRPKSPSHEKIGGAYVNCCILYAWQDGAETLAKYEVEKEWIITDTEEISWYEINDFTDEHDDKEYVDQAMVDGGCFVYNKYPVDARDGDEDFDLENATSQRNNLLKTDH